MNILLLFTRNPFGRTTGRKVVLRTIINSVASLGHRVDIVVVDRDTNRYDCPADINLIFINPPGLPTLAYNAARYFIFKCLSLNECAYLNKTIRAEIFALTKKNKYDVVIADMIRMAQHADCLNLPWILDLDDLLSKRYEFYLGNKNAAREFLGYYEENIPAPVRPIIKGIAFRLLRHEAGILAARELFWATRATAVSLISPVEAAKLQEQTGRTVDNVPMGIRINSTPPVRQFKSGLNRAVFIGGMDYQPNIEAVRYYRDTILPALVEAGVENFVFEVIGFCPAGIKRDFPAEYIRFVGYVEDLQGALANHFLFLAPIVSGTGIKTKVLEAMAAGLPILCTSASTFGLNIQNGTHCVIAEDGPQFATAILKLRDSPQKLRTLALAGHEYVLNNFSQSIITGKWRDILERLKSTVS